MATKTRFSSLLLFYKVFVCVQRYGFSRTDYYIVTDPTLSFKDIVQRYMSGESLANEAERKEWEERVKKAKQAEKKTEEPKPSETAKEDKAPEKPPNEESPKTNAEAEKVVGEKPCETEAEKAEEKEAEKEVEKPEEKPASPQKPAEEEPAPVEPETAKSDDAEAMDTSEKPKSPEPEKGSEEPAGGSEQAAVEPEPESETEKPSEPVEEAPGDLVSEKAASPEKAEEKVEEAAEKPSEEPQSETCETEKPSSEETEKETSVVEKSPAKADEPVDKESEEPVEAAVEPDKAEPEVEAEKTEPMEEVKAPEPEKKPDPVEVKVEAIEVTDVTKPEAPKEATKPEITVIEIKPLDGKSSRAETPQVSRRQSTSPFGVSLDYRAHVPVQGFPADSAVAHLMSQSYANPIQWPKDAITQWRVEALVEALEKGKWPNKPAPITINPVKEENVMLAQRVATPDVVTGMPCAPLPINPDPNAMLNIFRPSPSPSPSITRDGVRSSGSSPISITPIPGSSASQRFFGMPPLTQNETRTSMLLSQASSSSSAHLTQALRGVGSGRASPNLQGLAQSGEKLKQLAQQSLGSMDYNSTGESSRGKRSRLIDLDVERGKITILHSSVFITSLIKRSRNPSLIPIFPSKE